MSTADPCLIITSGDPNTRHPTQLNPYPPRTKVPKAPISKESSKHRKYANRSLTRRVGAVLLPA